MGVDQSHYFGSAGDTNLSPAGLAALIVVALLILVLDRKYLLYLFLLGAILIPGSQVVVVSNLHFQAERVMVLVAGVRCLLGRFMSPQSWPGRPFTSIDKCFALWVFSDCIMFTLLWGKSEAFTNRLGFVFTSLGAYLVLRMLIRDEEDIDRAIRALALVCVVCGLCMLNEQLTGKNIISEIVGTAADVTVREGKLRAQASFAHPLLAGSFGAVLIPVFVGLWLKGRNRFAAAMGMFGASLMAIASMSSTSVIGILAGIGCLCMWPVRRSLRLIRWVVLTILVTLHLSMKAPVWALISRIDVTGGSSGYHRYMLIDQAIRHFGEWWLVGTTTQALWGWDMWDSIDWYVNEATNGGLLTLLLFVAVLVYGFKKIGIARALADEAGDRTEELFIWALGAALFANALSFIGISYFDQSFIMWCTLLVIISTATTPAPEIEAEESPAIAETEYDNQLVDGYA
jgi:hypothetical protein